MGLRNRESGYELSGIEYKLLFEKENVGYVRFSNTDKKAFYLDPSPFLFSPKMEIFVLDNCTLPESGKLIEATVSETDKKIIENKSGFVSYTIKYIRDWKKVGIDKILHRRVLQPSEFAEFFCRSFKGDRDYIEKIGYCLSLYAVSSPQILDYETGGLNSALLSRDRQWSTFKRIMNVIPEEFKKPSSRNFYKFLDNEGKETTKSAGSSEVSIAYHNPLNMAVQIPIEMKNIEPRPVSNYLEDIKFELPVVRGFILDALLYEPDVPKKLESYTTDCVYKIIDEIKKSGRIPYSQDLGSAVPKLSLSFARLNYNLETTKENITEGVDLWFEMFKNAKKMESTQFSPNDLYKLNENSRMLYINLNDAFGLDVKINKEDIKKNTKLSEWDLDQTLQELQIKGALYCPGNQCYVLLDFR